MGNSVTFDDLASHLAMFISQGDEPQYIFPADLNSEKYIIVTDFKVILVQSFFKKNYVEIPLDSINHVATSYVKGSLGLPLFHKNASGDKAIMTFYTNNGTITFEYEGKVDRDDWELLASEIRKMSTIVKMSKPQPKPIDPTSLIKLPYAGAIRSDGSIKLVVRVNKPVFIESIHLHGTQLFAINIDPKSLEAGNNTIRAKLNAIPRGLVPNRIYYLIVTVKVNEQKISVKIPAYYIP